MSMRLKPYKTLFIRPYKTSFKRWGNKEKSMLKSSALDDLGRKYGTDKSSGEETFHDYLRKYEFFLKNFKDEDFTFLELGVFKGASLKMWEEYFPHAQIIGVDIEEETKKHEGGRIKIINGDISILDFLSLLSTLGSKVILDDASHWWPDQLRSLFYLFPSLPSGGLYILEDVHTSFQPLSPLFSAGLSIPPFKILLKIAEYMTGNLKPSPIVKDKKLLPLSPERDFPQEVRMVADLTDAIVFIERACLLIKK
jgi:hypothetical protein